MNVTKPKIIKIATKLYYSAIDLKEYDTEFFRGCSRTVRNIIGLKDIPSNKYCYASNSKRKGGWTCVSNQEKPPSKAHLLLSKKWVEKNVPMMNGTATPPAVVKKTYPKAPPIIALDDSEKFMDDAGNIVEIETRGTRTSKGIYFLVRDVSKGFNMPNIRDVVLKKGGRYKINKHCVYFDVSGNIKIFITYAGMMKIIYSSRLKIISINENTLLFWLHKILFNTHNIHQFIYTHTGDVNINNRGYVYLVTSDIVSVVKIGFWRKSLIELHKRYVTTYGKNLNLMYTECDNAPNLEKRVHKAFSEFRYSSELFAKNKHKEYISYLEDNEQLTVKRYIR